MGQVLIRNVDDAVIERLRETAVSHGRSLEAELRAVLTRAAAPAREKMLAELEAIRAMTPMSDRRLGEALVREGRDER